VLLSAGENEQVKEPMPKENLTVAFVRRGYSATGGTEAYLQRLARGIVDLGHDVRLITTPEWPNEAWPFGEITRVRTRSTIGFADELEKLRPQIRCDVVVSLERIWRCDVYRAGDGVHQAWLERRKKFEKPWQRLARKFNRKHRDLLRLEKSLLDDRGAERVIANSQMVKDEIVDLYNYRPDKIDIVRNGVEIERFQFAAELRHQARADLNLEPDEFVVLFAGTGWERKGLRFAVDAVDECENPKARLLVAGRADRQRYQSSRAKFLGEVVDLRPIYAAADCFILPTIYDPFSNACLEALASGLPVITTRANGFSEIIESGIHGSIVDLADDVPALREALDLWSDGTRRSAARFAILKRAAQFDISNNVAQTLTILLQAAAG
jgi:UDP-glucose:(heptosyl)LPS alpha-1,3-glucosyltransferase